MNPMSGCCHPVTNGIDIPDSACLKTTANIIVIVSTDKVILCKYSVVVEIVESMWRKV